VGRLIQFAKGEQFTKKSRLPVSPLTGSEPRAAVNSSASASVLEAKLTVPSVNVPCTSVKLPIPPGPGTPTVAVFQVIVPGMLSPSGASVSEKAVALPARSYTSGAPLEL